MAKAIKVVTDKVRFSYAHVFQPQVSVEEGKAPKYSVSVLIPKTDKATIDRINKAVEQCKEENKAVWGGTVPKGLKGGLRDGDEEKDDLHTPGATSSTPTPRRSLAWWTQTSTPSSTRTSSTRAVTAVLR